MVSSGRLVLTAIMAACVGAVLGGVAFGVGVYLANYTDMLAPFYRSGAVAGFFTGAAYALLGRYGSPRSDREWGRCLIPALFGAIALFGLLSIPRGGIDSRDALIMSASWLCGSSLLLFGVRRTIRGPMNAV
jgi:hypothetical protein